MKKTSKNNIFQIVTAIALIFTIFIATPPPIKAAEGDLVLWYYQADGLDDTLLSLINTYESDHGISISAIYKPYDTLRDDYKVKYNTAEGPDLIQGSAEWIGEFAILGTLMPLNSTELDFNDFLPKALYAVQYYKVDGLDITNDVVYYGFPQYVDTPALLYHVDQFQTNIPPSSDGSWTSMDMKDALIHANDQSNPDPALKQYGFTFLDLYYGPEAIFAGAGGTFFSDYTVDAAHFQIESNNSVDAMQYLYDLGYTYRVLAPFDKDTYFTDGMYGFSQMGNISSVIGMAQNLKEIYNGSIFSDPSKLKIAPIGVDTDTGSHGFLETTAFMINSESSEQASAIQLAKYLTSESSMVENAKNEYLLPASTSAYQNSEISGMTAITDFKNLVDDSSVTPISQYTSEIRGNKINEFSKLLIGNQNGQKTCTSLNLKISVIIPSESAISPIKYSEGTGGVAIPGSSPLWILGMMGLSIYLIAFLRKRSEK